MREAVRAARATVTLTQLAEAALAVRRGNVDPAFVELLGSEAARAPELANVVPFMLALTHGPALPPIPDELDDEERQILLDVALRALCGL